MHMRPSEHLAVEEGAPGCSWMQAEQGSPAASDYLDLCCSFIRQSQRPEERRTLARCVLKGKDETFYNGKGKHQLVWTWELCSTASHTYDKASFGAQDGQKAMKAGGRTGKVSQTFQLTLEKAWRDEGANYWALCLYGICKENFQVNSK